MGGGLGAFSIHSTWYTNDKNGSSLTFNVAWATVQFFSKWNEEALGKHRNVVVMSVLLSQVLLIGNKPWRGKEKGMESQGICWQTVPLRRARIPKINDLGVWNQNQYPYCPITVYTPGFWGCIQFFSVALDSYRAWNTEMLTVSNSHSCFLRKNHSLCEAKPGATSSPLKF